MKKILKTLARLVVVLGTVLSAPVTLAAPTVTYYHNDLAGTPVVATTASGQVIWRESYRPYGERLTNAPASTSNDIWFTSRRQDAETGLVYMGARYYDPVVGRFYSTDPAGFVEGNVHSFNRYSYGSNNPYTFLDPDGREVRVIGHPAAGLLGYATNPTSYHLALSLVADDKSYSPMTIGAQPEGGNLVLRLNYPGDSPGKAEFSQIVPTPEGMTDAQFIDRLVQAARLHDDSTNYSYPSVIPVFGVRDGQMDRGEYNSNSFVAGVLQAAGAKPPFINFPVHGQAPGWENPVPIRSIP